MGRMPKPQAAWHGHPAREGDMAGTARRRSRDTGATIILRPGLGVPKFAFLPRAAEDRCEARPFSLPQPLATRSQQGENVSDDIARAS